MFKISEQFNQYSSRYGIIKSYPFGITLCCIEMIEKNIIPIEYDF